MSPTAFLSYTRKDDEFFGGYITAFRKSLEMGVHVVTGEETFRLWQDIDGIVIGEQWEKKIADVLDQSAFLIPMLSPLFFNSQPCRDEIGLFLAHEKALARDDMILPVYFIESPKLEKAEEKAKDAIAKEIDRRNRFDWREKAKLPLADPTSRDAILTLARAIASALARGQPAARAVSDADAADGGGNGATERALHRAYAEAVSRRTDVISELKLELPNARRVLWVDDYPSNNAWERRALGTYGVTFVLATDTEEAVQQLQAQTFDAIISDMGRGDQQDAGFKLLERVKSMALATPYFIYCGLRAPTLSAEGRRRGARLVTNDPDELIGGLLAALAGPA